MKRRYLLAALILLGGCTSTVEDDVDDTSPPTGLYIVDRSEEVSAFLMDAVQQNYINAGGTIEMFSDAKIVCRTAGVSEDWNQYNYRCVGTFPQMNTGSVFFCDNKECRMESTYAIREI